LAKPQVGSPPGAAHRTSPCLLPRDHRCAECPSRHRAWCSAKAASRALETAASSRACRKARKQSPRSSADLAPEDVAYEGGEERQDTYAQGCFDEERRLEQGRSNARDCDHTGGRAADALTDLGFRVGGENPS